MELYRWDPFTALARMDRQFDEIVRRTWGEGSRAATSGTRGTGFVPAVEMTQDGADVLIRLELPGIDPSTDVDVTVHEGRLIVTGERRDERTDRDATTFVRELRYGQFRREFALPEGVTADDIDAAYDKGLLEVRVSNVVKPAPEPKRINVAVNSGGEGRKQVEGEVAEPSAAGSSAAGSSAAGPATT